MAGRASSGASQGAVEAARQHGGVDALGALVGAHEQRADHGPGDPGTPSHAPAPSARRRRARGPGPQHPPGLLADDGEVAIHEADDADEDAGQAQRAQAVDEVGERRRVGQEQRHLDGEPALDDDRQRVAKPLARRRQAEGPEVGREERLSRAREDEGQRHEGEGQHDPGAAHETTGAEVGHHRARAHCQRTRPRRPRMSPRAGGRCPRWPARARISLRRASKRWTALSRGMCRSRSIA